MAVKDESLHHATEDLILLNPRKYYQAYIHSTHWQLRSLIASPQPNIVLFISGQDVTSLNTKTRQREVLFTVKFTPRCLAASKEWICVGGDGGDYVAVSNKEVKSPREMPLDIDLDADDRLPLDLDVNSMHRFRESTRRNRAPKPMAATSIKVGSEIVNCITLWSPAADTSKAAYSVPVSVVANNDKTVLIQSLAAPTEQFQKISFAECVNRAVISPDGSLLATISDDPFLYIHERRRINKSSNQNLDHEWVKLCRIQLEGQGKVEEQHEMKGCFAVCFSISGRYLAVATQYGIIQIFEVDSITESGSLLAVFTTSRPCPERDAGGAVRAMAFSPGPFDLLAWTESNGRTGIADMRDLCFSRQLLKLDHTDASIEKVQTMSKSYRDSLLDPRLRPLQVDASLSTTTPDYLGLDFDRRQVRHLNRELGHRGQQTPLTTEELSVLQAHRIARQQRDAVSQLQDPSNDQNVLRWSRNGPLSLSSEVTRATRDYLLYRQDRQDLLDHLLSDEIPAAERRLLSNHLPRRRNSISNAASQPDENTTSSANTSIPSTSHTTHNFNSTLDRLAAMAGRPTLNASSSESPWADLNAWMESRGTRRNATNASNPTERSTRLRIELEGDGPRLLRVSPSEYERNLERQREFSHRLRQPWNATDIDDASPSREVHRIPDTMGLAWSEDGRVLYAGASDGIYEFHVNITGRKVFPDLVLR